MSLAQTRQGSPNKAVAPHRWGVWSTFGPHAIGAERFTTVSSGTSFAQVAGAIQEKQTHVQISDKDALLRSSVCLYQLMRSYRSAVGIRRRSR
jgi:hypothetical protein